MARDEIHWLLRHFDNPPSKKHTVKLSQEDFVDRQLPELLFNMEELKCEYSVLFWYKMSRLNIDFFIHVLYILYTFMKGR